MNVICIEEQAFYSLIDKVVSHIETRIDKNNNKWMSHNEVMELLNIKSKTTLQKMRNEGNIRFTQLYKKIILYDRESINDYLERNAQNTF